MEHVRNQAGTKLARRSFSALSYVLQDFAGLFEPEVRLRPFCLCSSLRRIFIVFVLLCYGCEKASEEKATKLKDSEGITIMPGETIKISTEFALPDDENVLVIDACDLNLEISGDSDYWGTSNEDGSLKEFWGGSIEAWQKQVQYEKKHPESYLTGANLAIYNKLLELEAQIKELQKKD